MPGDATMAGADDGFFQAWMAYAPHHPQPMLLADAQHRLRQVNPSATQWFGCSAADAGRPLDEVLPLVNPTPHERNVPLAWSALLGGWSGAQLDVCLRLPDQRSRWFRLASPATPGGGHALTLTDIDRYRSELASTRQQVREGQALINTLNMHAIVSEADAQGNIVRVNRKFELISGYSAAELIGSNHRIVNSGLQRPAFWEAMWDAVSRGQPWRGDICNRAKNGTLYWVDSLIVPQLGADGLVEKYTSIRTDITRYKLAQIALSSSRRMLARTGKLAGVGGWFQNGSRDILYLSAECLAIYQIDSSDLNEALDAPGYYAVPMTHPKVAGIVAHVSSLSLPFDTVVEVPSERQGRRWLRLLASGKTDEFGQTLVIGAVVDVTAVVRSQQRLQENERTFRAAMDALGEAFALYDPQERLVFCNTPYRELFPESAELIQPGARMEEIVRAWGERGSAPVGPEGLDAWMQERMRRFRARSASETVQLRNGRWLLMSDRQTPDGFHVAFRIDVTETQEALARADAASRSKSQFLANMSHEIRTPMNAILGMLRLLEFTELSPRQGELVDKTTRAARSLLAILNDILDFSKVEAGKMTLDPEPFVVETLLSDLSTILSGTLGGKSLELVFDLDPALPPVLVGDALRLKQVLINLLGNAVKFTSLGEVVLRLDLVRAEAGQARVRFEVSDTGIGIPAEQQQFIFTGFSQAEASTARQFGGTGLGLAISQRLVGMMGGVMRLESEPGHGSRFYFDVDLGVSEVGAERSQAELEGQDCMPRVWLAGCRPRTGHALTRGLMAHGCVVTASADAPSVVPTLVVSEARLDQAQATLLRDALDLWRAAGHAPVWVQLTRGGDVEAPDEAAAPPWQPLSLIKPLTARGLLRVYCNQRDGRDQGAAAAPPPQRQKRLQGLRLLLVEDNAFNQEVALEMLRREGATVDLADNGQVALNLLRAASAAYDLVLMDMQMPVMDGLQATQAIRRIPELAGLPIVAMTANAMPADRQVCLDAGMNAHIGKPFDLDEVVQVIRTFSGADRQSAAVSPAVDHDTAPAGDVPPLAEPALFAPEAAMHRLGDDPEFFQRMLRAYPDTLCPQLAEAGQAWARGDSAAAAAVLHRIKSGAASVGADRLAALAAAAEQACKTGQPWAGTGALQAAADEVLAAQAAWLQSVAPSTSPPVAASPIAPATPAPAQARAAAWRDLLALETLARTGDMAVFDACADWATHHAPILGLDTTELQTAIDAFDTDVALEAVARLKTQGFDLDRP